MKRLIDLVSSALLLLVLAPAFAVVAALIWRADKGPAFFVQERIGRGGRRFRCYKFRTMRPEAEKLLEQWKQEKNPLYVEYETANFKLRNDPRVTTVGRWLRATSLDELPQLINVLLGDMSLVGPRPLLPGELRVYGGAFERYQSVRPGITGLWQVSGRSNTTFQTRIELDVHYIENMRFTTDLVILLKTLKVLLSKEGAY